MNKAVLFFIVFINILSAQEYSLVWSDEFDGAQINTENWTHEIGGHGWGNNESQYYTNRAVNSFISDGKLIIKAIEENYGGKNYTSARMITMGKKSWKYGKIEAKIKLPYGKGIWPAFWMLGANFPIVGWPKCGEIDIMEMIGGGDNDATTHGTAHWDYNNQLASYGGEYKLSSGILADDFHLFSIIWDEQKIEWYIDNTRFHVININDSNLNEFHEEFFIILNIAVGGNWPGEPDASTVFPQTIEIDYVRVFQKNITGTSSDAQPEKFLLHQNYPNPFNPATLIRYSIPAASKVQLQVYNSLGCLVEELINTYKPAGEYTVEFNAKDLPSGVYFYILKADNYIESKKMLLLR